MHIRYAIDKKPTYYKNFAGITYCTEEQFDILRKYVNDKMVELCDEMLSGQIKIEPTKSLKVTYCDYCDYSSICQFDTSIKDNKYKVLLKKDKEEIWDCMKNKIEHQKEDNNVGD